MTLEQMKNYDPGVVPSISFGPNDRLGYRSLYLYKVKNGEFVYLAGAIIPKERAVSSEREEGLSGVF
jgi:hypothetical protein